MVEFKFLEGNGLLIIYLFAPYLSTVPVLTNCLLNKCMLNKYFLNWM